MAWLRFPYIVDEVNHSAAINEIRSIISDRPCTHISYLPFASRGNVSEIIWPDHSGTHHLHVIMEAVQANHTFAIVFCR